MKVSIVGVGRVGSALALSLIARGIVDELVLIGRSSPDQNPHLAGEAMDLLHASAFTHPTHVRAGSIDDGANSDVIAICASAPESGANRAIAAAENAAIFRELIPALVRAAPKSVLLITSNPLDVMTTMALRLSGLPPGKVIGTGTLLDTVRLRVMLSQRCGIHPLDIRAYVLGEHGDSQFAVLSAATAGGAGLDLPPQTLRDLEEQTRRSGYEIMRLKGSSSAGVAFAATAIIHAIATDSREIIPVSTLVNGFCGVQDVCLSLPAIVGRHGVVRTIDVQLTPEEAEAFRRSSSVVLGQLHRLPKRGR